MPNAVKSFWYIKCYSSGSPIPVNGASTSIRYNCHKICSWSKRPKTILGIRKKTTFRQKINNPIIYKFFKDFTNHWKKTNKVVIFSCRPFPNILKYRDHQWNLPRIWKTRLLETLIEEFSYYVRQFRLTVL